MLRSLIVFAMLALTLPSIAAPVASFKKQPDGIVLITSTGATKIQLCTDSIVRVMHSPSSQIPEIKSLAVIAKWPAVNWTLKETSKDLVISTGKLKARIDRSTGAVKFTDGKGNNLFGELPDGSSITPATYGSLSVYSAEQKFDMAQDEAFYGLGCMQFDKLDYRGEKFKLYQQNTVDITPVMLSSKGYGVLWDNPSTGEINIGCDKDLVPTDSLSGPDGQPGGLKAEYFSDSDLKASAVIRTDKQINFNWWRAPAEGVDQKKFSVRWTGQIKTAQAGAYKFSVDCDDGVRLWVNGKLLIDDWVGRPVKTISKGIVLDANTKYGIKMEYFQAGNTSYARLYWHKPIKSPFISWSSQVAEAIDYYFIYGPDLNDVIASYRKATGQAPMFGKWAYGLWQCKEHYHTQQELLDVAEGYRSRSIPIDNIVQDWYYWNPKPWGSHEFDPERYPDMAGAIKTLHEKYNLKIMISVWPKFDPGSKNYDELKAIGGLFPATQPCAAYYDPFNPQAREIYWRQMKDQLFSKGIDAWWLDATEPEYTWPIQPDQAREFKTGMGAGAKVWSAYPLMTTQAIYEGQRKATSDKRVYILTRSCYAGIQRNASVVWSGDIVGTWDVFKKQVASGLNFCMTGIPYWATDIGGFQGRDPQDPEYRELFLRWFEWGSFCPIFRVHGTNGGREMWKFGPDAEKIQVKFDNLRYRLLPYIYSTAWMVTDQGYSMMRALPMDFRTDPKTLKIADQFMFGPSLLINPVLEKGATSRSLYLPAKTKWYDFWTGEKLDGGKSLKAAAPIDSIPIYVRAGAIIPMGPFIQYSTEKPADTIEIRIYRGADGKFTIYEDENDNYNYEKGAYSLISLTWNEAKQTLTIGKRKGSFPGMLQTRTFDITFAGSNHGTGLEISKPDITVKYDGEAQVVSLIESKK
ncbi:MAG: PA14 domain-containing protein [Armatimonadetes bacterium]|nr:PA14 domain-containing protein [Armatimonadota bacterium]